MMTFDDAKECTFTPFVNGERKKTFSIKGWIDGLGENFKLRFPMIFKDFLWVIMIYYYFQWFLKISYDCLRYHLIFNDSIWIRMMSYDFAGFHMIP